jgi:hypothetical protein
VLNYDMLKQLKNPKNEKQFSLSFEAIGGRSQNLFAKLKTIFNKIQLPFVMCPRLDSRTWIPILAWIDCFNDDQTFENTLNTCSDDILSFVLADHFFGNWKNEDKLLRAMLRKVKQCQHFPRIEEFEELPEAKDSWFQQISFPVGSQSETRLLKLPLSTDEMRSFIAMRLRRDNWPLDVDGTLWKAGRWVDLLLWNQRSAADEWFETYQDDIRMLGAEGRPWDHDHIVPHSYFYGFSGASEDDLKSVLQPYNLDEGNKKQLWERFRSYRNHTGNYRVWPSGANRSDQDCCAKDKLDQNIPIKEPWLVLSHWWNGRVQSGMPNWLNSASAISTDEFWLGTAEKSSDWGKQQLEAFIRSVAEREIRLYVNLFDKMKDSFSGNRFSAVTPLGISDLRLE